MNEYRTNEDDFGDYLHQLINFQKLEGAALGITKLVIDKGFVTLSDRQKFVFNKEVIDNYTVDKCINCHSDIPWPEMLEAIDNGGYCGYCRNSLEKLKKE